MNADAPNHLYEWAPLPETREERQRREQQERQHRQLAFYDTEKGIEMLSTAMCSYIRYDRTLVHEIPPPERA